MELKLLEALHQRYGPRWLALRVLATTFPGRTAGLAVWCLLGGVMPAVFAVCVGAVISALPGAASAGLGSPEGQALKLALLAAAGVLLAGEAVGMARGLQSDDLYRRFDEAVLARAMAAVLSPPGIAHLEDPEQQQRLALALRRPVSDPANLSAASAPNGGRRPLASLQPCWLLSSIQRPQSPCSSSGKSSDSS